MEKTPQGANRLIHESSPYLLQHAYNPVDWHPWGEEALNKAAEENKMLLISIGYAACHWCHVMEHESFEDTVVAQIMNDNFICVKVDREERPDVDDVYMTACQLSSGGGCGWPLNAFALPDGRPVWAGTYFPKENWKNILIQFKEMQHKDLPKLERAAESITKGIANFGTIPASENKSSLSMAQLAGITESYLRNIDLNHGGRMGAPKFPMPNNTSYLLNYYFHTSDSRALDAALVTLHKMAGGGIYDQIGGGFARYSVDSIWKVPHFEKMLYDNGQLLGLYSQAYALTGNKRFKEVIEETIAYLKRDHLDTSGGFYSSYDADSEGEEGTFYVWTAEELKQILEEDYTVISKFWNIKEEGNWEHKNILFQTLSKEEFVTQEQLDITVFNSIVARAKAKLFHAREKREKPGLDDKILTSWNGLLLSGLVHAYNALGDSEIIDLALKNGQFIREKMLSEDGRLDRNFKNGQTSINGFLDDYANIIEAYILLYQATFDLQWLDLAKKLNTYVQDHFYNQDQKMYDYKSNLDPPLIAKTYNYSDNVIPSGNSIMARNLFSLGTLLGDQKMIEQSSNMLNRVLSLFAESRQPSFYSNWLHLYLQLLYAPYEVAILGPEALSRRNKLAESYRPNVFYLGGLEENLPLLENKLVVDETYIYVCKNKTCKLPTQSVEKAEALLTE